LQGFIAAWQDAPELGTLHRLERDGSHAIAIELPMVNVADAIATDVEVR
jgi:hypothetical protein